MDCSKFLIDIGDNIMFRRFVTPPQSGTSNTSDSPINPAQADQLFRLHPAELSALLELAWQFRRWNSNDASRTSLSTE